MKKPILVFLITLNLVLKTLRLEAPTVCWSNLFHLLITLFTRNPCGDASAIAFDCRTFEPVWSFIRCWYTSKLFCSCYKVFVHYSHIQNISATEYSNPIFWRNPCPSYISLSFHLFLLFVNQFKVEEASQMQQTNRMNNGHRALTVTLNKPLKLNSELYTMHARTVRNITHKYN